MIKMEKTYDPKEIEEKLYHRWQEKGWFHADENSEKKPYILPLNSFFQFEA